MRLPLVQRAQAAALWRRVGVWLREIAPAATNSSIVKANVREALTSLRLNPQRAVLAVIGIVLGVASVTAMVSVGVAARAEARDRFKALGTETLVVYKNAGGPSQAPKPIRPEDVALMPGRTATIALAAPVLQVFGSTVYRGRSLDSNAMLGVTADFAALNRLAVRDGRFISDLDVHRPFCVLGSEVAEEIARRGGPQGEEDLVGETIALAGRLFTVVGVLDRSGGSSLVPFRANSGIMIHLSTAQRTFVGTEIQVVVAQMVSDANPDAAIAEVRRYFNRLGVPVRVASAEQLVDALQQQMRLFTLLLAAVGGISLVVGGASAMNVMLTSVTERRREVGIRRALGARRGEIRSQFLTEAIALAMAGGTLGIVIGIAVTFGICLYAGWAFSVSVMAMALGFLVASTVGIFFGAYPASRAAALDPITALRSD